MESRVRDGEACGHHHGPPFSSDLTRLDQTVIQCHPSNTQE